MCTDITFLTVMLRVILNDLDDADLEFTDSKLKKILATAAKIVIAEVDFVTTYTVTINYDPPTFDVCPATTDLVQSMIVLKAACLIDHFSARAHAFTDGLKALCGPVSIQSSPSRAFEVLLAEGACKAYADLKHKVEFTDPMGDATYFAAVMGPFISNTYRCTQCGTYQLGSCSCGY